jgi:hypothetical protein
MKRMKVRIAAKSGRCAWRDRCVMRFQVRQKREHHQCIELLEHQRRRSDLQLPGGELYEQAQQSWVDLNGRRLCVRVKRRMKGNQSAACANLLEQDYRR